MITVDLAALAPPAHAVVAPLRARTWRTLVVRPGDTLWDLAMASHTTPGMLITKNRLGGSVIHPGQRLLVPGSPAASRSTTRVAAGPARTHIVRAGETLWDIALAYRTSLTKLLAANRLSNPGLIQVGQRITLPGEPRPRTPKPRSRADATSANTFAGYTYDAATVAAASRNRAALARASVPSRAETAAMIRRTALRHGVDPKLALAIAWQESGWNQRVVSVANAIGTMQVIPPSGQWASDLSGHRLDLLNTEDNITAGVVILRALQASASSRNQAIAGYYQGLTSVRDNGQYEDTKLYVSAVLAHYGRM